jgi:CheY-like chemotaxis protein
MHPGGDEATFRRDGDFWTLSLQGRVVRMKDGKGMKYIARLLASAGTEIHALDLVQSGVRDSRQAPALDGRARAEYAARVRELSSDAEGAEALGDVVAAERARAELDALATQLRAAYGLGGRARAAAGDAAERARKAATERIRTTIARIERVHDGLGRHLRDSIRTGTFCSYSPVAPVRWTLHGGERESARSPVIRVVLVDDHPLWRDTLRQVLEREEAATVVAEAGDGNEAVDVALRVRPDVVVMDVGLPGMRGDDATRRLVERWPEAKVLVVSSSDERESVVRAVAAGAHGYVLKTADATRIAEAVRRVHDGELVLPAPLSRMVLAEMRDRA